MQDSSETSLYLPTYSSTPLSELGLDLNSPNDAYLEYRPDARYG
jgi:hypothetical protein